MSARHRMGENMPIRNLAGVVVAMSLLLGLSMSAPAWAADTQASPASPAAPLAAGGTAASAATAPAAASQVGALYQLHVVAGLNCAACHKETPPATPVSTATCLTCHGSYDALAKKTENVAPNPHASHQGDLPCESCHHIRKASVDFCDQCHQWGFKVP
jgi:fumarate reductase flavoprotein subunit